MIAHPSMFSASNVVSVRRRGHLRLLMHQYDPVLHIRNGNVGRAPYRPHEAHLQTTGLLGAGSIVELEGFEPSSFDHLNFVIRPFPFCSGRVTVLLGCSCLSTMPLCLSRVSN